MTIKNGMLNIFILLKINYKHLKILLVNFSSHS